MSELSEQQMQLLMIKGAIADLPMEQQVKVIEAANAIGSILNTNEYGLLALALVGATVAVENDISEKDRG